MAKWGEGDPRWLVEHREDGQNVNGWHWEEKDRMGWTKARLAELFSGLMLHTTDDAATVLKVERLKDVTGDASITTRKGGKRFAVYDLSISLAWEGAADGSTARGEIRVEEIHSTGDEDDFVYTASVDGTGSAQSACKALAASSAVKAKVYATIAQLIAELREQA